MAAKKKVPMTPQERLAATFCDFGISKGCKLDQLVNFWNAGVVLQSKQMEMSAAARSCDHRCPQCCELYMANKPVVKDCLNCGPRAVGVGGARGGGKSQWMAAQVAVDDCHRFPGLCFLYVRKSAKTLASQMQKLLAKTLPPKSYNYRQQAGIVDFPNGSSIVIRHFKDESEIDNFLGEEYDGIAYEELTTLSQDKFTNLNTCLRTSKKGWRPRVYASWNWGGIGHSWVKKFFYDPWLKKSQVGTRYILALATDNKHNNPEYINDLQDLVGWKYQSWFLGNPDLAAGNFFSHYREDVHVYPSACPECKSESTYSIKNGLVKCGKCDQEYGAITFFDHDAVRWFGSMDYGSSHPNCLHLHAEKSNGDIFTVGESHTTDQGISENCESFQDLLRLHNIEIGDLEFVAAGHDVMRTDRKTKEDGSTISTEYESCGVQLTAIHINRVNAFSQMQERLGDPERGKRPTWYINRQCTNLRAQIQTAQCDPKKPNDILKMNADKETGEGGDDALESARNGIVGAYNTALTEAKPLQMGNYKPANSITDQCADGDPLMAEMISAEAELIDRSEN